jgi:RNA polymerase sigma-70 factor, ECF subfamily
VRQNVVSVATIELVNPPAAPEDDELIQRTLAGDESAFARIVSKYQRRIDRIAYSIVRDAAEADVITQETFVQAYLHLSKFERRAGLETWLTRIAINRARDVLRRRARSLVSFIDAGADARASEPADGEPDAERRLISREVGAAIERAISTLSPQQKTIFRLRHYEELPLEEIAGMLGLRAGTVRAHLFRAVHRVRQELAPWFGAAPAKEERR